MAETLSAEGLVRLAISVALAVAFVAIIVKCTSPLFAQADPTIPSFKSLTSVLKESEDWNVGDEKRISIEVSEGNALIGITSGAQTLTAFYESQLRTYTYARPQSCSAGTTCVCRCNKIKQDSVRSDLLYCETVACEELSVPLSGTVGAPKFFGTPIVSDGFLLGGLIPRTGEFSVHIKKTADGVAVCAQEC